MSFNKFVPRLRTYAAAPGIHALTQRWIYTCPLGQRAEVVYMHTFIQDPVPLALGNSIAFIRLTIGGVIDNTIPIDTRAAIGDFLIVVGCVIDLAGGDTIEGYTQQGAAGALVFRVQAIIREYQ